MQPTGSPPWTLVPADAAHRFESCAYTELSVESEMCELRVSCGEWSRSEKRAEVVEIVEIVEIRPTRWEISNIIACPQSWIGMFLPCSNQYHRTSSLARSLLTTICIRRLPSGHRDTRTPTHPHPHTRDPPFTHTTTHTQDRCHSLHSLALWEDDDPHLRSFTGGLPVPAHLFTDEHPTRVLEAVKQKDKGRGVSGSPSPGLPVYTNSRK